MKVPENVTTDEVRRIVHEELIASRSDQKALIRETVAETLKMIGMDYSDPIALQQDFAHLRRQRLGGDALKSKAAMIMLGVVLTGAIGALVLGIKEWVRSGSI